MDNSYFIFSEQNIEIERFHLCTWEFKNGSALMELGGEIVLERLPDSTKQIILEIYIPWLRPQHTISDLFPRLKEQANAKFIFNDAVQETTSLDGGRGLLGVVHSFQKRSPLCMLPASPICDYTSKRITVRIDLSAYLNKEGLNTNVYFRFAITTELHLISIRKKGLGRTTLIYDIKINEGRNLPDHLVAELQNKTLCPILKCFCFTIVPNSYDFSFYESDLLRNVRTLEYEAFHRYLEDRRVQKDQLMVVFSKKEQEESYTFFTIFTKERIGAGQFALAILINLVCGILLFLPGYRSQNQQSFFSGLFWKKLPTEVYLAIGIGLVLIVYFIWPIITALPNTVKSYISYRRKKKK